MVRRNATNVIFRDMITLALLGFAVMVIMLVPWINEKKQSATEGDDPPGNVLVEAHWPNGDIDVDLWVQAPGDVPVGYSNKGGLLFNLLRDDLGAQLDASGINYENSYTRGIVGGEYTVNLHLYSNRAKMAKIPAQVIVSVKKSVDDPMRQILSTKADLTREGEERTFLRFKLDDKGDLIGGSVNSLNRPIRTGMK